MKNLEKRFNNAIKILKKLYKIAPSGRDYGKVVMTNEADVYNDKDESVILTFWAWTSAGSEFKKIIDFLDENSLIDKTQILATDKNEGRNLKFYIYF